MVKAKVARRVIRFLVQAGTSTPMDVGVCALNERNGVRAWRVLNDLRTEGYVVKTGHAAYRGHHDLAAHQREIWP